jgi:hypothetical protein
MQESKLALLDGVPVLGKSMLTLDLGIRQITGRPLAEGNPGRGIVPALVLTAEDGPESSHPRRPPLREFGRTR